MYLSFTFQLKTGYLKRVPFCAFVASDTPFFLGFTHYLMLSHLLLTLLHYLLLPLPLCLPVLLNLCKPFLSFHTFLYTYLCIIAFTLETM